MLVGFASLGSFSSRFSELVGMSPSSLPARCRPPGAGCLPSRAASSWTGAVPGQSRLPQASAPRRSIAQSRRSLTRRAPRRTLPKTGGSRRRRPEDASDQAGCPTPASSSWTRIPRRPSTPRRSVSRCASTSPWARSSRGPGAGFRWLTVGPKDQPDLQIILSSCDMGRSPEAAAQLRALVAGGSMGIGVMQTDDCHRTYKELARQGRDLPVRARRTSLRDRGDVARRLGQHDQPGAAVRLRRRRRHPPAPPGAGRRPACVTPGGRVRAAAPLGR